MTIKTNRRRFLAGSAAILAAPAILSSTRAYAATPTLKVGHVSPRTGPLAGFAEADDYILSAYVPGVKAEELQIEILEDVVSIKGEFIDESTEDTQFLRRERPTGSFARSMRLPTLLNASGAEAEVVNGVLKLRVPKAEEAKPKQIKVNVK